jgi:type 1 glutamine amidotransferase/glyoxylase-like metal-dependent hydrolase (beta-lactamase superfamily II)
MLSSEKRLHARRTCLCFRAFVVFAVYSAQAPCCACDTLACVIVPPLARPIFQRFAHPRGFDAIPEESTAMYCPSACLLSVVISTVAAAPDTVCKPVEVVPGVFVLGSSHRHHAANVGWVMCKDHVVLIGAPDSDLVESSLAEIARSTGKPLRGAIITHIKWHEVEAARSLVERGVSVWAEREAARVIRTAIEKDRRTGSAAASTRIREFTDHLILGDPDDAVVLVSLGNVTGPGDTAVHLPKRGVLFAGAIGVNGPRAELPGTDTARWIATLRTLRTLPCRTVIPGYGTIGGPPILDRLEQFLGELRRQIGHLVAQELPLDDICSQVRIEPEWMVWMPYDQPQRPDIEHVYHELTIPHAPFAGRALSPSGSRPRALALIGDRPHEPGHIEQGLRPALEQAGTSAFFAVDTRALTAANLGAVQLLVILRDGATWPGGAGKLKVWMTPEQETAVVNFVERGGGLLALHNATALYPQGGPYLKLLGGAYTTHGPLERFRVNVLDRSHFITRDVSDFEVADEQHVPIPDRSRVHVLLESRSADAVVAAAGWAYQFGRGRVCYLANGHTREALEHPEFQKLLRNAARWCVARDGQEKTQANRAK